MQRLPVFGIATLLLLLILPVYSNSDSVTTDSSNIEIRLPNEQQIETFRNNPDFKYDRKSKTGVSIFERAETWFWEKVLQFLLMPAYSWLRYLILYSFIALAFGYAYYKLRGQQWQAIFAEKSDLSVRFSEHPENLQTLDLPALIQEAEQQQQFRLAVRWQFLKILKELEIAGMIRWHPHKTNRAYLSELGDAAIQHDFSEIIAIYEYAWYGHFDVEANQYQRVSAQFSHFRNEIKTTV